MECLYFFRVFTGLLPQLRVPAAVFESVTLRPLFQVYSTIYPFESNSVGSTDRCIEPIETERDTYAVFAADMDLRFAEGHDEKTYCRGAYCSPCFVECIVQHSHLSTFATVSTCDLLSASVRQW